VRRLAVIAVLALGLAACGGGSSAPKNGLKIVFGRTGGSIFPYQVTIAPDGKVTAQGAVGNTSPLPKSLTSAQVETLSSQVRSTIGELTTLQCSHTSPDEASSFITALGKTVSVRGNCEPRFLHLFYALTNAIGVSS
jgi:hypothetical protein